MRRDPEVTGSEAELLAQYLDYQRETVLTKTDGLNKVQMRSRHAPSTLTLGGLLLHLSLVEEDWSEVRFAGLPDREPWAGVDWDADPDWEFRTAEGMEPEDLRQRYRLACARTREVVDAAGSLDALSARPCTTVATSPCGGCCCT